MSQPPAPYDRSYSFTDFSQSNPTTPHQGQKIDQELNNARTAINATISRLGEVQADDGKIRTTALNLPVIAEEVEPLLTDGPVQAVNAAGASQIGLVNDAGDAKVAELEAVLTSQNAIDALAARDDAEIAASSAAIASSDANSYAGLAQGYSITALQAKNSALVHANTAEAAVATIAAANYANASHTHTISNVTGLQTALGSFLPLSGGTMTGVITSDFGGGYTSTLTNTGLSVSVGGASSWIEAESIGFNSPAGQLSLNVSQLFLVDNNTGNEIFITANGLQEVTSITFGDSTVQTTAYTGGGGSFTGGIVTSPIVFDGTSGQYISKGNFDTSRGGNYGISLVCSIGYEFNWQAGWLAIKDQSNNFTALNIDGRSGLRVTSDTDVTDNIRISPLSLDIYKDDVNVLELGDWGLGVADSSNGNRICEFTPFYAYVKKDGSGTTIDDIGVTFPDATTQATAAATNNTQLATSIIDAPSSFTLQAGNANTIIKFTSGPVTVMLTDDQSNFPIGAQVVFINMTADVVSFTPDTGAVMIYSADNLTTITKNYGTAVVIKIDANTYVLSGNLA